MRSRGIGGMRRGLALGLVAAAAGCGPLATRPVPPAPAAPAGLPPIPRVSGPLALNVVYPAENASLAVRDANFIFGSTGTGDAQLRINGEAVPVEPNGAFLAFLPVPPDGIYRLEATAGTETDTLLRQVRVPAPPVLLGPDSAVIVPATIAPRGAWAALPGERIDVRFRGTPGGTATLLLPDGRRIPLVEDRVVAAAAEGQRAFGTEEGRLVASPQGGVSEYRGYFPARPLAAAGVDVPLPTLVPPGNVAAAEHHQTAVLELVVGSDTARAMLPLNLALVDPERPPVGVALDPDPIGQGGDGVVIGRPGPGYTYHYFWPDGTRLTLNGERNGEFRVQLTSLLSAWVPAREVRLLPAGTPPARGRIGTVRFTPAPRAVDVRLSLAEPLPFRVEEGARSLELVVYGGTSDTDFLQYGGIDPLIERAQWSQPADDTYRLTLDLSEAPWGYQTFWAENGDLILSVRRPPQIDPRQPLRGLLVAVDPGHPPAGATGPTGLTEAEANLAIALRLRPLLQAAGARVLMTRTDASPVALQARPRTASEADADLFVSVHNNAFPDGVNPFVNAGTSVYYFFPRATELARDLQAEILAEFGLRNLGIGRGNFAVIRNPWFPGVLTESMFMMIPRQEAALRDPGALERLARAHVRGLENFLRERAAAR